MAYEPSYEISYLCYQLNNLLECILFHARLIKLFGNQYIYYLSLRMTGTRYSYNGVNFLTEI